MVHSLGLPRSPISTVPSKPIAIVDNCRLLGAEDRVNSVYIHAISLFELILVLPTDLLPFFFFIRSLLGLSATALLEGPRFLLSLSWSLLPAGSNPQLWTMVEDRR